MATYNPPVHKTAYLAADLDVALRDVDFDKVHAAIETTEGFLGLGAAEQAETKELVWLAAENWLAHDLQELDDPEFEVGLAGGKAVLDIRATLRGTLQPYAEFPGSQIVIDWKTTNSNVDTDEWRNRCLDSWQWKIYLALSPAATVFNYRGISRLRGSSRSAGGVSGEACRVRNVMLKSNSGLVEEVREQKRGILSMYNSLIDANLLVWPRNTKSCYAFNKRCPFKRDCDSNTMPLGIMDAERQEDLSHSRMDAFLLCPERLRRSKLVNIEDSAFDGSDATVVGGAFHAGVAALWAEAFRVRG